MRAYQLTVTLLALGMIACDVPEHLAPTSVEMSALQGDPFNRGYAIGVLSQGSWRYTWDHTRSIYKLQIQDGTRQLLDLPCVRGQVVAPRCGGISGGSGFAQLFVHIYYMSLREGGSTSTVIVAARGDATVFEAAILPDETSNRTIFDAASGQSTAEVAALVRSVAASSEDVIRGTTLRIDF